MQVADFPRPRSDNGRGVHWSASIYHPRGSELQTWIVNLQAMGMKWVKLLDDGGASSLELCQRLLDADIMPVVRLWRDRPNPGHMDGRQVEAVGRLIAQGVRYFESNNEPDLPAEWRGPKPQNWLEVVIDNFIWDADAIIEMGGLPALPAMGDGGGANPFEVVARRGRADLFERGAWAAIHNYTLNHPLDYPDDDVNQVGRPLTAYEYEDLARWAYGDWTYDELLDLGVQISRSDHERFGSWAWDGRSMSAVNSRRARDANPGQTVFDDANCFRRWEVVAKMAFDALGFRVPLISTEGGPVVGWGDDQRYAKVNPWTQAAWQLEIARFMEHRAPPWYFACCTWMLASYRMGDMSPAWEQMSWYTNAWDLQFGLRGELPIVQLLKNEQLGMGVIEGSIRTSAGRAVADLPLALLLGSVEVCTGSTGTQGEFRFEDLVGGRYRLEIAGQGVVEDEIQVVEGEECGLHLWLGPGTAGSIVATVRDIDGQPRRGELVTLLGPNGAVGSEIADSAGIVRFTALGEGIYRLRAGGTSLGVIVCDGWGERAVELVGPVPLGLRYTVARKRLLPRDETSSRHMFFGEVVDHSGEPLSGVEIQMSWVNALPGTTFPRTASGRDPYKPAGYYEFTHTAGEFYLQVTQGDWESDIAAGLLTAGVPGREGEPISYEVDFRLSPLGGLPSGCSVAGSLGRQAAGRGLTLHCGDAQSVAKADAAGRFAFRDLASGIYSLELDGLGIIAASVLLENGGCFELEFPMNGVLAGQVAGDRLPDAVYLHSDRWDIKIKGQVDSEGRYRLEGLAPGPYRLDLAGQVYPNLWISGRDDLTLYVIELPSPMYGHIRGRVLNCRGVPVQDAVVWLQGADSPLMVTRTAADGSYSFGGLLAGTYAVSLPDADVGVEVSVDGTDVVSVPDFLLPSPDAERVIDHYLLLGHLEGSVSLTDFLLVLEALQRCGATGGFSAEVAASEAHRVTIVGDSEAVSAEDEAMLREAGCSVERMDGDSFDLEVMLAALC